MAAQKMLVVPGMPMAALNNVRDENTRQVLAALVDAHNVRNGATGKGGDRFITAAEVGLVDGNSRIMVDVGGGGGNSPLISPAAIGRIIADLQAQVIESPLFKDLGERVDMIDKPGGIFDQLEATETKLSTETSERKTADTAEVQARKALGARVGTNEAAILTEKSARVNGDNAIVQSTTTQFTSVNKSLSIVQSSVNTVSNSVSSLSSQVSSVQASVGANTTAIQQESTARVTADGVINSKYTVKIDNNGYVAGYGLMSTSNNSAPFSEFIVRADRFAIGSAAGPGIITPTVPFIVLTQQGTAGGEVVPPGVYMQDAFIKNGSITNGKIGNLEVDTLKIRGNAVTIPFVKTNYGTTSGSGLGVNKVVAEGFIDLDYPGMVYAIVTAEIAYGTGWRAVETNLQINGVNLSKTGAEEGYVNCCNSGGVYCNAGRVYVRLFFRGQDSGVRIIDPVMFIQGAMR